MDWLLGADRKIGWKIDRKIGTIFDDSSPSSAYMAKRMAPLDFPRQIYLETTWNEVLIVA